jgi:hypothetical protein
MKFCLYFWGAIFQDPDDGVCVNSEKLVKIENEGILPKNILAFAVDYSGYY